jgi:hypothetical protein
LTLASGFPSDQTTSIAITKPIVDMGISLEHLQTLHRRISVRDADQFLHWVSGAYKIYDDYLTAWRLEFDDLVVNLAPATHSPENKAATNVMSSTSLTDSADTYTERVDVAYLLKRPLMRVKYLAKAIKVCIA